MIDIAFFEGLLREKQYKMTVQRKTVLEIFVDFSERHLSAEDVYGILRERASGIGLATVYRTLELLAELELLEKLDLGDGRNRYEMKPLKRSVRHHHLICMSCGKIREVDSAAIQRALNAIEHESGYSIIDHQVKLYGYCHECRK
ncbi:MAG: Fur family transcriptional regulator [Negativicutes bacterium]|jgi:Fur family ferric uptake transcriptional regulator